MAMLVRIPEKDWTEAEALAAYAVILRTSRPFCGRRAADRWEKAER